MQNPIGLIINLACKYIYVAISHDCPWNVLSNSQYLWQDKNINRNYTLMAIKSKSYDSTKYLRQTNLIAYCGCYGLHYAKRD